MPLKRIKNLTPEQVAAIPAWNERWIRHVMSCDPIDKPCADEAILGMYRAAKLAEPRIGFGSTPLVLALAGPIAAGVWYLRKYPTFAKTLAVEPRKQPRKQPREQPRTKPRKQPREQPRTQPREQPRTEPREQPRTQPRTAATDEATYAATYAAT